MVITLQMPSVGQQLLYGGVWVLAFFCRKCGLVVMELLGSSWKFLGKCSTPLAQKALPILSDLHAWLHMYGSIIFLALTRECLMVQSFFSR